MGKHSAPKQTSARGNAKPPRKPAPARVRVTPGTPIEPAPTGWAPFRDAGSGTAMVAVAMAVSSAILGSVSLVPSADKGDGDSVYMASTGTNVLHGIAAGEPLPFVVPPHPYEPEDPRPVLGPEPLQFPNPESLGTDLADPLLTTPGSRSIPPRVLAAYQAAARIMRTERPSCHMSWPLIAGIGRIESGHARNGDVDAKGTTSTPILGPALTGEGNFALIRDTDKGRMDTDTVYDRAVGPMQFLPGTWAGLGRDGNGDGKSDPNNVADAALATAGYLCLGGGDMLDREQLLAAVFRYNRSWEYVSHVLSWAGVYAGSYQPQPTQPGKPGKGKPGKDKPDTGKPTTGPTTAPIAPVATPAPSPTPTPQPTTEPTPEPTPSPTPEPSTSTPVSVGGRVFRDTNANTVNDPEDRGVPEATVRIFGTSADGSAVDLTVPTDAAGNFTLTDLAPGTYAVAVSALPEGLAPLGVVAPAGWLPGQSTLDPVELAPGTTLLVGFIAGP